MKWDTTKCSGGAAPTVWAKWWDVARNRELSFPFWKVRDSKLIAKRRSDSPQRVRNLDAFVDIAI